MHLESNFPSTFTKQILFGTNINQKYLSQNYFILRRIHKMLLLIFGCFIAGVGHKFVFTRYSELLELGSEELRDPCPNQAATWLLVMGLCLMLTHAVVIWTDCKFMFGDLTWLLLFILDFCLLIWGSILVFSRYPTWTKDWKLAQDCPGLNYCEKLPMITACVSVIFIWIFVVMILVDFCIVLSRRGIVV